MESLADDPAMMRLLNSDAVIVDAKMPIHYHPLSAGPEALFGDFAEPRSFRNTASHVAIPPGMESYYRPASRSDAVTRGNTKLFQKTPYAMQALPVVYCSRRGEADAITGPVTRAESLVAISGREPERITALNGAAAAARTAFEEGVWDALPADVLIDLQKQRADETEREKEEQALFDGCGFVGSAATTARSGRVVFATGTLAERVAALNGA
jgi:hypothetical protein